jgi:hypothetical protein
MNNLPVTRGMQYCSKPKRNKVSMKITEQYPKADSGAVLLLIHFLAFLIRLQRISRRSKSLGVLNYRVMEPCWQSLVLHFWSAYPARASNSMSPLQNTATENLLADLFFDHYTIKCCYFPVLEGAKSCNFCSLRVTDCV